MLCKPMSYVPPSPANPTAVTCFPFFSKAACMPLRHAPVFSNAVWKNGTFHAPYGNVVPKTTAQLAGTYTEVSFPSTRIAFLIDIATPQPGHAVWPAVNKSSSDNSLIFILIHRGYYASLSCSLFHLLQLSASIRT